MTLKSEKVEMKIPTMPISSITGYANLTPTFLLKLVNLLQEPEFAKYVSWSEDGQSFVVHDQAGFSKYVLPKYFKHNKFASFVRQLNMYGFRKVTTIQQGSLDLQHESIEFLHPFFKRGEEGLLQYIKRKVTQSNKTEELSTVLEDVTDIKNTQTTISVQLSDIKRENEDLWREVVSLRQKHAHQQKVVNRLIQFLVSLVQHHGGVGLKRALPLMIESGSGDGPPFPKLPRNELETEKLSQPETSALSPEGPLITELLATNPGAMVLDANQLAQKFNQTDELPTSHNNDNSSIGSLSLENQANMLGQIQQNTDSNTPQGEGPSLVDGFLPSSSFDNIQDHTVEDLLKGIVNTTDDSGGVVLGASASPVSNQLAIANSPQDINSNIDLIQNNLHSIKRRLSNNQQVKLDYDLIQELFNNSVDITPSPNVFEPSTNLEPSGNELVQYTGGEFLPSTEPDDENMQDLDHFLTLLKD